VKVGILAGGMGSRLAEETEVRPKPMVEVGGEPILWHIMKHYAHFGLKDFVVALGYKGVYIKQFFIDYCSLARDLKVDLRDGTVTNSGETLRDWRGELIDTGPNNQTGGRGQRWGPYLGGGTFMLTYGDGLSDVDLHELLAFHRSHGRLATMTAVRPPARFGHLELDGEEVSEFSEKPQTGEGWINGAFFVLEPEVFNYIDDDDIHFEREPLERLAKDRQLMAYCHHSFWQCMDTIRDKQLLERLWDTGHAPWAVWDHAGG